MAKKRVHEIAKAQGLSSKELLAALSAAGVEVKAAASSVEESEALRAIGVANKDGATATKAPPASKPAAKQQAAAASGKRSARSARKRPTAPLPAPLEHRKNAAWLSIPRPLAAIRWGGRRPSARPDVAGDAAAARCLRSRHPKPRPRPSPRQRGSTLERPCVRSPSHSGWPLPK